MTTGPVPGQPDPGQPDPRQSGAAAGELSRLVHRLCDDSLSQLEFLRLQEMIRSDAVARRRYYQLIALHAQLAWTFGEQGIKEPAAGNAAAKPSAATAAEADVKKPVAETPRSPVLGFLGGVVDYVNHSRRLMLVLIAAALCGWFAFQIGSVLLGRWLAGNAQVAGPGTDRRAAPGSDQKQNGLAGGAGESPAKAPGWLSGSVSGRWQIVGPNPADPDYWPIGTEFAAGQQVKLVAGLAEITLRSGAKVVLTAPVQFSIVSTLRTDLQLGKLAARVPHDSSYGGASGFTVATPAGSVVDLGTEFGVEVTPDHKMDVQVFVGEVKIDRPAGSEVAADGPTDHVQAGQTVHVEPGKPTTVIETKENRFHRDLELNSDSREKQVAAYLDFVRQLKPVVWLRMTGKEADRTIRDEMGKAAEGKLHWDGPGNPFVSGRLDKGLWLRGPKLKDYAVVSDYPKAEHGKLSVSAWVFADSRPPFATVLANGFAQHGRGQFQFGLISSAAINPNTGAGHFVDAEDIGLQIDQANGEKVFIAEGQGHLFPLNEWQHVAFVADGAMVRLYRQGKEVASAKYDGLACPVKTKQLTVGAATDESGDPMPNAPGYWSGQIDEVTIFNDALTPDDIKKLAAAPPR